MLDNLPKYLTVHKAHVVDKKPLRLSSGNQGRRTPPAKRRLVRKLPTLKWWQRRLIAWLRLYFPWLTTLYNQHVMAIDFKNTLDLAGNTMAVFNLIDHGRRVLHWSRATYNRSCRM